MPTGHAVVIAGGGLTGLMLAAELALARCRRRHCRAAPGSGARRHARRRIARAHHRDPRSARGRGPLPARRTNRPARGFRLDQARHQRLSPRGTIMGSRCGRATSSVSSLTGSTELAVPIYREHRGDRFRAGRDRRRHRAVRRPVAAGKLSRRLRRRPQPGAQGRRHQLRRLRSHPQQPHGRGRDDARSRHGACARMRSAFTASANQRTGASGSL